MRDTRTTVNLYGNKPERSAAEVVAKLVQLGVIEPRPESFVAQLVGRGVAQ